METIEQSIDVDAPIQKVYNQWTQFETFPEFMEGIEEVRQFDDKHLHWVASVGGKRQEWDAEIYEQVPDQRIAWRAVSGKPNQGAVSFEKIADNRTRIRVVIGYEAEGAMEKVGDALGIASARVKGDLKRFKELIENTSMESGAWRGEIQGSEVTREGTRIPRSKRMHGEKAPAGEGSTGHGISE